ncbi:energy transducer TonB [Massilia sp. P8910]|uniref:energy transducer TonB n=1 Tax=Massilia antarctica TaxID=2765360 RepID=UPI001E55D19D|nr:energy transducer TonB [Massilia antarctica]MCE3602319.1 energy transducer TonB [Massilia antarctica]
MTPSTSSTSLIPTRLTRSVALLALAAGCMAGSAHAAPARAANTHAIVNLTSCAKPAYPAEARAAHQAGTVKLAFLVDASGDVVDTKVKKSSGHVALDDAARNAIKLCKFSAATAKGKPVESWVDIAYVWKL